MTMLDPGLPAAELTRDPVSVLRPSSLDEALRLLAAPDTAVLGGGVGHLLRRHDRQPSTVAALVSVGSLPELRTITWSADHVSIGAGVRLSQIEADARLAQVWPVVTEAAHSVATGRIRCQVTLGGNIAARDDSHDPPVALAAAGATYTVCGAELTRIVRAEDAGELCHGEVIRDVRLSLPTGAVGSAYEKFLVRGLWEYACVNVAAVVRLDQDGRAHELSLAVGSVTGGPVVVDLAELHGAEVDDALLDEIGRRASAATEPYSDVRGSARYKTEMIAEFSRRAVTRAVRRAESRDREEDR